MGWAPIKTMQLPHFCIVFYFFFFGCSSFVVSFVAASCWWNDEKAGVHSQPKNRNKYARALFFLSTIKQTHST